MKYSLRLRSRRALNRSEARGCLAANLAIPGAGSLAAGLAVGYAQLILTFVGFVVSILTGIPMIEWCLKNWASLTNPESDSLGLLVELWKHALWPLAGIGLYAIATLWAAVTGYRLVSQSPEEAVPPKIDPG
jgi:hypothetical protein